MNMRVRHRLVVVVLAVVAVLATATAALATTPTRSHSSTSKPGVDLSGVTLHAGDQLNILRNVLQASGEDKNVPYHIDWSTFVGGPAVLAAETGGSVDVGFMAETPLVFAQAAGNPVKVIAAGRVIDPKTSGLAIVVHPDSDIKKLSQLKGKRIGYSTGTITQYFLLNALKKAGLSLSDVQAVNFTGLAGQSAFDNGDIDASVTSDPFLSGQLADKSARVIATGAGLTPGFSYLVARNDALSDKKLNAALSDFVARATRAYVWWNAHPAEVAKSNEATFKLSPEAALAAAKRAPIAYQPIDDVVIKAQQAESDAFLKLGVIKSRLDAAKLFDTRYNKAVSGASTAAGSN
jgi:sulfonate transport system substrate-binding protein